jgi:hypothetical protein
MITTQVAFHNGRRGVLSRLEVRTNGLNPMSALRQVLFDLRVQMVRALMRVDEGDQVVELDVVEFDGAPLSAPRRHRIQAEVIALLTARVPAVDVRLARRAAGE